MDISLFDYELNSNLIAQKPCVPRDHSRLLNCTKEVAEDLRFKDLPSILNSGDVLVVNNTKVISSRLFGKRDQVNVEVTLHMKTKKNTWNRTGLTTWSTPQDLDHWVVYNLEELHSTLKYT